MNKKLLALAAMALVSLSAQAHRGWLLPSAGAIEGDKPWVTVDAAVSEALFDFEHQPLKLDGLTITAGWRCRQPAKHHQQPLPQQLRHRAEAAGQLPCFAGKRRRDGQLQAG